LLLVDSRVVAMPHVVIGSGVRHSKIALPGPALGALPGAEVIEGLARDAV
jgi:prolyl-tRNA editing enzyme YbaK/EbsC (Cys-tRNA(Pro) deacylase)